MCGVPTAAGEVSGVGPCMVFVVLLARDADGCRLKELERMFSGYVKNRRGADA